MTLQTKLPFDESNWGHVAISHFLELKACEASAFSMFSSLVLVIVNSPARFYPGLSHG